MKPTDQVGITFVNTVIGSGVLHNVVNIQMGVFGFDATEAGKISNELTVACRLRMDRVCAKQLHESLGALLSMIEKEEAAALAGLTANGHDRQPEEVLN